MSDIGKCVDCENKDACNDANRKQECNEAIERFLKWWERQDKRRRTTITVLEVALPIVLSIALAVIIVVALAD